MAATPSAARAERSQPDDIQHERRRRLFDVPLHDSLHTTDHRILTDKCAGLRRSASGQPDGIRATGVREVRDSSVRGRRRGRDARNYVLLTSTGNSGRCWSRSLALGRRTALTFPLRPPPQKNRSPPSDSSPDTPTPGGISSRSNTSPVRGSTRRMSLSSPSQVPCQSSPSTQVTPVTKRLDSMVRRIAPVLGST